MDIYTINPNDGYHLICILDRLRKSDVIVQYNGNDYNEVQTVKHGVAYGEATLFDLYGFPTQYYLLVHENSLSVNVIFEKYRVAYTFQEYNNWKVLDVEAFGDSFYGNIHCNSEYIVGRAGVIAVGILAKFCSENGYESIMKHSNNNMMLQTYFYGLLKNKEFDNKQNVWQTVLMTIVQVLLKDEFSENLEGKDLLFIANL